MAVSILNKTKNNLIKISIITPNMNRIQIPDIGRIRGITKVSLLNKHIRILNANIEREADLGSHMCSVDFYDVPKHLQIDIKNHYSFAGYIVSVATYRNARIRITLQW